MNRILLLLSAVLIGSAIVACSSTSKTASPSASAQDSVAQQSASTPSWFNKEEVTFGSSTISGYATAIDSDSASAVSKAVERATILLRQSVSNRLEAIRTDAVKELGSESGLDRPGFLIALRKADSAVNDVASTGQVNTKAVKGQSSLRGFAEVQVDRAELIKQIGEQLSSHQETWNKLFDSAAFSDF